MAAADSTSWERVPIIDLCAEHVDCVNRTAPVVDEPTPFKMIRTTNVRNGFIDTEDVRYVTEETYKRWTRRLVPKRGDVILTREAPLGDVGKIRTDDLIFLGQRLYHFRPDPKKLDSDFLLYALMAPDLQGQIRAFGSGATVEHMRLGDIPSLEINVPPLSVQRRIAGILSAYDDLIENNQRRIKILEEMARSLYREWFVHFRFPGHDKVKMVSSSLGAIPQGWEVKKLGEIAEDMRRNVPKGQLDQPQPYVGLEHIPRRSLALDVWEMTTDLGSNKLEFKKGEVLFGKIRPYFHKVSVAPFDGVCSADTIVIRARRPELYAFVVACVSSDAFVAHASATANGAKMPRAKWDVLEKYEVVIPCGKVAERFSAAFTDIIAQLQALIFQVQNLRRTRDLLIPRLLSGQINVGAQ
jgi:type I restriction enzyme, S subunit